jgi:hypothetical protein
MIILRCAIVLAVLAPLAAADEKKADEAAGLKIVAELFTPEASKKGVEIQQNAAVPADFELNLDVKKLGLDGKVSAKKVREKFGAPTKVEKYATKEDGKVVNYEKLIYPPIALTVPAGGDQATLISAPKRLWGGEGILENARAAAKKK